MPACHIGIAQDARGPNNTVTLDDVSSLSALCEASRVLDRGQADVMIAGGVGSRIHHTLWARNQIFGQSQRSDSPTTASRPFDAQRDGLVHSEGAGAVILETRCHAQARSARVLARVLGYAGGFESPHQNSPCRGSVIRQVIGNALRAAKIKPANIGFVVAHGLSTVEGDRIEAQAIRDTLGDVPVTALKSYYGYLGAASGALESVASVLAFQHETVPPTLNYEHPDPQCPIHVIHGQPMPISRPVALILAYSPHGQAVAIVLGGPSV
jgi:3-oxoacyl-[acyl-carrier-protein] synthase II